MVILVIHGNLVILITDVVVSRMVTLLTKVVVNARRSLCSAIGFVRVRANVE